MLAFLSLLLLVPLLWWLYATTRVPGRVSLYVPGQARRVSNPHVAVGYRSKESRRKTVLRPRPSRSTAGEEPAGADCDPARRPSVQAARVFSTAPPRWWRERAAAATQEVDAERRLVDDAA